MDENEVVSPKTSGRRKDRAGIAEALLEIGRRYSELPDKDTRTPDEILGYDENGLPT